MTKLPFLFLVKATVTFGAVVFLSHLSSDLLAQETQASLSGRADPAFHSRVTLDNNTTTTADDYLIFPFVNGDGTTGLGFTSVPVGNSFLYLQKGTPVGSVSLAPKGVGIGLAGFDNSIQFNPQAPLHVVGGGPPGPFQTVPAFGTAQVIIEDRNNDGTFRNLLRLINGGPIGLNFEDTSTPQTWRADTVGGRFNITDPATNESPFAIFPTAPDKLMRLHTNGVGIGTASPISALHVLADGTGALTSSTIRGEVTNALPAQDRVMLDLRNNGSVVMNMLDSSVVGAMPFQIRAANNQLAFQQFGGNRAGFAIFGDGAIRFVANGQPNLTVTGNGNLNVIGQAGGGNLNVIGPTGGAGNLFVKGNIVYNGTLSGPSDRNLKENFKPIDPQEILAKVVNLPITKWNYIADEKDTPHLGPMAQDFYSAFGLGDDQKRIPLLDNNGVALAAIQGLNQVVDVKTDAAVDAIENLNVVVAAKEKKIAELNQTVEKQSELISELSARLERLEAMVIPVQE